MPHPMSRRPHSEDVAHHDGRDGNPTVPYTFSGPVRWLDTELARIVLHVAQTSRHAGRFLGQDVTFDVAAARVSGELLPGVEAQVGARLPRDLGAAAPEVIAARSVRVA